MSDSRIDLSGPWLIRPDPGDVGEGERWGERPPADGWREIRVPCAWQDVLGQEFHGVAWYRRTVEVPPGWVKKSGRLWLRFESVATDCAVWVNGRVVGRHVGDFLPFQFEVTTALGVDPHRKGGALVIVVRVDEVPAPRPAPGILTENGHITKGFHDVLSLHHGGIWGGVSLRRTGQLAFKPNGVSVTADARSHSASIAIELEPHDVKGRVTLEVVPPGGDYSGEIAIWLTRGQTRAGATERFEYEREVLERELAVWSPSEPVLGEVMAVAHLRNSTGEGLVDEVRVCYGFRTLTTGGPNNSQILLNGKPVLLRGVLHWGHEPGHGSPAPTPDEVRDEFTRLKALGFNLVCLCMVYMPEYFYEIADEMGMLIWQEHPVWKSRMEDELVPEYQRLFEGFFRRDRNHPSVILVSGACEHECFNPALANWWWETAQRELPNTLVQVQTAFLAWTNPGQTDLHDEHTYENSGRFAAYMNDVHEEIGRIGPKPFIMGETIIGTSWIDAAAVRRRIQEGKQNAEDAESAEKTGTRRTRRLRDAQSLPSPHSSASSAFSSSQAEQVPWWAPKGLAECEAFEAKVTERFGAGVLEKFKRDADRFNLSIRRAQSEVFRSYEGNAGWVMNHIRDVPQCRCGFKDDAERWRFAPEQTRAWLGDVAVLLGTPDHRRGFAGGRMLSGRIGVSAFGASRYHDVLEVFAVRDGKPERVEVEALKAEVGEVRFVEFKHALPRVDRPTRLGITASAGHMGSNAWDLWLFPSVLDAPADVVRLDGLPFSERDLRMDWEERAYSSGWGLKVQSWKPILPDLSQLLFKCPLWRFDAPMPLGTRVVVTHKLTERLIQFMESGGRVVLLASKTAGGLDARTIMLWGQCPLVIEDGPLEVGESAWVLDLLHHDLTRRHPRAIPVEEMGIADQVDPVIRLVFTHDSGAPKLFDAVFKTRVGKGMLLASSLDHSEDAGRYLLHRLIGYALDEGAAARVEIDAGVLRKWTAEAMTA